MEITAIFRALSNPGRLDILRLLLHARRELCICEIMDVLGVTQYGVSKHVRELKLAGLCAERREGRFVFYSALAPEDKAAGYVLKAVGALGKSGFRDNVRRLKDRLALRREGRPAPAACKCG